jgi:hypothetical protein
MDKPTNLIPLGPEVVAPETFTYRSERRDLGCNVEIQAVFEAGRFVVDRLTIQRREGGPPITTEVLRGVGVAIMLHVAVESNVMHPDGHKVTDWPWLLLPSQRAQAGCGPAEEDLRNVATLYQVAYATGNPPTKTVMDRFGLPRSTASRWIALARKRGLLGPATPRKAGG